MTCATLILASVVATAFAGIYRDDPSQQKALWESFKLNFKKSYGAVDEETRRFGHFLENLKAADLRNLLEKRNGGSAVHGITSLSDLSQAEFELNFLSPVVSQNKTTEGKVHHASSSSVDTNAGLVDWTGIYTTPVKDQVSLPTALPQERAICLHFFAPGKRATVAPAGLSLLQSRLRVMR
jgi:hypothetical protein